MSDETAGLATDADAVPGRNPFVGPRSIQYGEKIYGRSREITELADLLVANRILLMYSPSGAGKTSLIDAGLRPRLDELGIHLLPTIRVGLDTGHDTGRSPTRNRYLASTMQSLDERRPSEPDDEPGPAATATFEHYLDQLADELGDADRDRPGERLHHCFVFDQFEELFTLDPTDQPAKLEFMKQVGRALRDRRWWALFSMREDFIAQLDPYVKHIPTRLRTRYRLDLLDDRAAIEAAKGAAKDADVDFADDAVRRLVDDLRSVNVQHGETSTTEQGPYVEPVQLQVVCRQLWNKRFA